MDSVILNAVKKRSSLAEGKSNLAMLLAKSLREILRDAQDDIDDRMLLAKLK